jgi:hypothetical protein
MTNTEDFDKKYANINLFLRYAFEDAVVRMQPDGKNYVKFKGKKEFLAEKGSGIVTEARLGMDVITEAEYDKY